MDTLFGKPLTFGDQEQIAYINREQQQIREEEARKEAIAKGEGREFKMRVRYLGCTDVTVIAVDRAHAEKLAIKKAGNEPEFIEVDYVEVISERES